ncbi:CPBP family intramembrane glutamic endopeptidase [Jejudonia soesokkakensis]|uniref:CPBP family intramembrane glutamic endopeptidase n=1 Tax=Jejudonia soesokkakensis TaxID=1323432 RepID=A0ABW2MU45_9FLAO
MKSKTYLLLEFFIFFILLPVSLAIDFLIWIKVGYILAAFIYILVTLKKSEAISFQIKKNLNWKTFWRRIAGTFLLVLIATTIYVYVVAPENLFFVPLNNPLLFVVILCVYVVFSVWPQEIIYRTFFFERYEYVFQNKPLLVFINAIVFSLAHLFFKNTLVLVLTFIGGLMFGFTYLKYRSTTAVTIEHALYGNWLFTVGMGQMLAFPGIEPV